MAFAVLAAAGVLAASAAIGARLSRLAGWELRPGGEGLLYSSALGFAALALGVFFLGVAGVLFPGVALALLAAGLLLGAKDAWRHLRGLGGEVASLRGARLSRLEVLGLLLLALSILVNGFISLAPLTGSDPLQYHFEIPKLYARAHAIYPIPWSHASFFLGLPHMLILLGIVLGSDQIALAINFGGALLSILAVFHLSSRLLPRPYPTLATVLYATSPMIYWPATSGYIDPWTVFFTVLALDAFLRWTEAREGRWLAGAGLLAGFAAASKYTLLVVPLFLALAAWRVSHILRMQRRDRWDQLGRFSLAALLGGAWPYLRNLLWTGDPLYPVLTKALGSGAYKPALWASPEAGYSLSAGAFLLYPFRMILQGESYGGGHFFGPAVLALLPLLYWAYRGGGLASRTLLAFSAAFFAANALTSQIPRYLLPIFPLMLVLLLEGLSRLGGLRRVRLACAAVLALSVTFNVAANGAYAREFLPFLLGAEGREEFLKRKAPDYTVARFLNQVIPREGKALVLIVHPYYLDFDYILLPPEFSPLMDGAEPPAPAALASRLRELRVTYVIKTRDYPPPVKPAWDVFEACCLEPVLKREIWTLQSRRHGRLERVPVAVFRLKS